jgi:hypothetical protein
MSERAAEMWSEEISETMEVWETGEVGFRAALAARNRREVVPSALVPVESAEHTMAVRWREIDGLVK